MPFKKLPWSKMLVLIGLFGSSGRPWRPWPSSWISSCRLGIVCVSEVRTHEEHRDICWLLETRFIKYHINTSAHVVITYIFRIGMHWFMLLN